MIRRLCLFGFFYRSLLRSEALSLLSNVLVFKQRAKYFVKAMYGPSLVGVQLEVVFDLSFLKADDLEHPVLLALFEQPQINLGKLVHVE